MKVADGDQGQVADLRLRLAETKKRSTAHVDENLRLIADPQKIAGCCAIAVDRGPTRTKDLDSDRTSRATLTRRARGNAEQAKEANYESNHGRLFLTLNPTIVEIHAARLTSRMTRRKAVGVDAAVSGHERETASNKDAEHGVRPQR